MTSNIAIKEPLKSIIHSNGYEKSPFHTEVINDFWIGLISRELSLQGRREVLSGKAKFGIFGDGKELPQLAMAKAFRKGDYRSGYYRDQTLMLALGLTNVEDFLSQMYSDTDHDPYSSGRQMNSHFATPFLDDSGEWLDQTERYNISSGVSCTGGQMGRALGLAFASKVYRELPQENSANKFSNRGSEICFCTIGDGSTSEGVFWETVNAAAVLQVPLLIAVWDDGYGISVPRELQTAKGSISEVLKGFKRENKDDKGIDLYTVKGWDYAEMCVTFDKAAQKIRRDHVPAVVHVTELTQPQGHSTSGSHERYKSKKRLAWEAEYDCLKIMQEWMIKHDIITEEQAGEMKNEARRYVRERKHASWKRFQNKNDEARKELKRILDNLNHDVLSHPKVAHLYKDLLDFINPNINELLACARQVHYTLRANGLSVPYELGQVIEKWTNKLSADYSTHLYSSSAKSALQVPVVAPVYSEGAKKLNGYQIINTFFDRAMAKYPNLIAFGEDVGKIGDVNQGLSGLQKKYGSHRIFDTGIREWTILGQGMGCAMRGLKPIAEIQYLDYLVYALPLLTDDVSSLRYRSNNQQQAPMIVRTRGHRLEGIWHTGSPMGMILHSLRGIYILTPRNMVQAAGLYNTMLQSDDPAILIECLNGYRLKEKLPDNIGEYTIPLGVPEVLSQGKDVTIVTYGSCVRVALQALTYLRDFGIEAEIIDVQTLIPFDLEGIIINSLKKTNKVLFLDEDVPGGASAYMMQKVLEEMDGFHYLDAKPITLTAKEHRTPYGSDGDYYAKPQTEDVVKVIYELVFETEYSQFIEL